MSTTVTTREEKMKEFYKSFSSFKEFIEYEMDMIVEDDLDLYDEIVDRFLN
jgi:predicted secreted protein